MNSAVIFVLALLVAWMFQISLAALQIQRYYKRLRVLRHLGKCATGMAGSRYKGRIYGAVVVDPETQIITHAERLSGMTVFAGFRPVPALVGLPLARLASDDFQMAALSKRTLAAFQSAAKTLDAALNPPAPDAPAVAPRAATTVRARVSPPRPTNTLPRRTTPAPSAR